MNEDMNNSADIDCEDMAWALILIGASGGIVVGAIMAILVMWLG